MACCRPGVPGQHAGHPPQQSAWHAAYAAFREVASDMPEAEAKMQTTLAIAYAAANHTAWFWGGVYDRSVEQPVGHSQRHHQQPE